jgi:hypothetical protein
MDQSPSSLKEIARRFSEHQYLLSWLCKFLFDMKRNPYFAEVLQMYSVF